MNNLNPNQDVRIEKAIRILNDYEQLKCEYNLYIEKNDLGKTLDSIYEFARYQALQVGGDDYTMMLIIAALYMPKFYGLK